MNFIGVEHFNYTCVQKRGYKLCFCEMLNIFGKMFKEIDNLMFILHINVQSLFLKKFKNCWQLSRIIYLVRRYGSHQNSVTRWKLPYNVVVERSFRSAYFLFENLVTDKHIWCPSWLKRIFFHLWKELSMTS